MAVRKTGSQTTVNRGITAAAATPVNIISGTGGATVNISSVQIANSTFHVKDDLAIDTAGGYLIVNGTGFNSGAVVYVQGIAATSTAFVNSTRLNVTVPALSSGTLDVYVVNTDGSGSIYLRSLSANGVPSWTTTSPLTSQSAESPFSINLVATGAAGDGTIIYAVSSGSSLPTGTSLASNGYFYGTVTGLETETTYSFSVDAIDAQNQETARSFNITFSVSDSYFEYVTLLLSGNGTNGSNNNTFVDSSNNAFLITRNGNTTQGSFSPFSQTGWSNFFTAASSQNISAVSAANTAPGTGDFCAELWYYTISTANQAIFGNLESATDAQWTIAFVSGNTIRIQGWYTIFVSGNSGPINQWNHVAVCRSGTTMSIFVNGVRVGTATVSNDFSSTSNIRVGGPNGIDYFNGYISNARFVKGSSVYDPTQASITVPTAPLTAITNTKFLTCQSNRFVDNSTNNFTLTLSGTPSVQAFSPFSPTAAYASGTIGGSGYFDGTGDYLTLSGNTNLALGSGNFTIELWVNITSFTTYGTFATTYNNTPVAGTWFLRLNASTQQWQWQNGSDGGAPNFKAYNSSTNLIAGAWHHLAVVRSSGVVTLYQDGVNVGGGTDVETLVAPTFWIGQTINGYPMNGYISNLRIVKGTAVYTTGFTPPTAPLTAITNTQLLLNFTNAGITDATAKNVLETVGNAQISTTQSKFGGSSMYFDGTGDYLSIRDNPAFEFGSGDFTVEFWVNTTQTGYKTGISKWQSSQFSWMIRTNDGGDGKWQFFYSTNGTGYTQIAGANIADGQWHHIAVSRSGSSIRLFTDGVLNATNTSNPTIYDGTAAVVVGSDQGTNDFLGYIDDLRITKGVARYTGNFTPPNQHSLR